MSTPKSSIGVGATRPVLRFRDFGWVFDDLDFRAFFSFWILERVLTVGVRGQFCDSKIFQLIPTLNDLSLT